MMMEFLKVAKLAVVNVICAIKIHKNVKVVKLWQKFNFLVQVQTNNLYWLMNAIILVDIVITRIMEVV